MMERFLTKKARPHWLRVLLEVLLALPILVWTAAGVSVMLDEIPRGPGAARIFAYVIVTGLPLFLLLHLLRTWRRRNLARKIARVLAVQTQDMINWETLRFCCPMARLEETLETLLDKGYLCDVTAGQEGVSVLRGAVPEWPGMQEIRCSVCGEMMEKRTGGDWACRRCGNVISK